MSSIPQDKPDVNGSWIWGPDDDPDEIPFYTEAEIHRTPEAAEPVATPLADALAASYRDGSTDAAGADAAVLPLEEWLANEPAWDYWEDGATPDVAPNFIYFDEVIVP